MYMSRMYQILFKNLGLDYLLFLKIVISVQYVELAVLEGI